MLTISIQGKKEMFNKIKHLVADVKDILEEEIVLSIDEIYDRAQMAVPTNIEGGLNLRAVAYKDYKKLQGEVGYNSLLAAYYEFGTGAYVDIPQGLEDYAMTFYINGLGRIEPQAFLFPAFFSVGSKFGPNVLAALNAHWNR